MKNLIVSLEKLPSDIKHAVEAAFPDGFDHLTFDFRMPTDNVVYNALRFSTSDVNYVIKLSKKNMDNLEDPSLQAMT